MNEISPKKLKELNAEAPQYSDRYADREFKSKYSSDLVKGVVEIIKNGVDAYINEGKKENKNNEIKIILEKSQNKNPSIKIVKIINFAKGMDSKKFEEALKIGADTSGDKENTGAQGYGMKEAAWAFKSTMITTIVDNKYSRRLFFWDDDGHPKSAWYIENKIELKDIIVNSKIREDTEIANEGTCFEAIVPDDISFLKPETLCAVLSRNILLRKIILSNDFKISIEYKDTKSKELITQTLKYTPPVPRLIREDQKELISGEFSFNYPKYGTVDCKYKISVADIELENLGDSREAGILICANSVSVLDCTLFELGDKVAKRFFGEVMLSGNYITKICKNEKIIDNKRESGLLKKTPLYENLYGYLHPILAKLIDKERNRLNAKMVNVPDKIIANKNELLKAFNKLDDEINKEPTQIPGMDKFIPGETGIRFCVIDYLKLVEKQGVNVYIVIDPKMIPLNSEINITCNKPELIVNPCTFEISEGEIDKNGIFKKKIFFKSNKVDCFSVTANVKNMLNKADMEVLVNEDPRLHIKNAIEFVPSSDNIVSRKKQNFSLIIDFSKINKSEKLTICSDNLFSLGGKLKLAYANEIANPIFELLVPIVCNGRAKQKGQIVAEVGANQAKLDLTIIDAKDKHLKGNFEGIHFNKSQIDQDIQEFTYYENKIINIFINHPLFKHYSKDNEDTDNLIYRGLLIDAIIREFCKEITRKKTQPFINSGDPENYRSKFDKYYNEFYAKHCVYLHKICIDPSNLKQLEVD